MKYFWFWLLAFLIPQAALAQSNTLVEIQRFVFSSHAGKVTHAKLSANLEVLATSGEDSNVIVWNQKTGKALHILQAGGYGEKLFFSPDGTRLLTQAQILTFTTEPFIRVVRIWDVTTGELLSEMDIKVERRNNDQILWEITGLGNNSLELANQPILELPNPLPKKLELNSLLKVRQAACPNPSSVKVYSPDTYYWTCDETIKTYWQPNGNLRAVQKNTEIKIVNAKNELITTFKNLTLRTDQYNQYQPFWSSDGLYFSIPTEIQASAVWHSLTNTTRVIDGDFVAGNQAGTIQLGLWEGQILWFGQDGLEQKISPQIQGNESNSAELFDATFISDSQAILFYARGAALSAFSATLTTREQEIVRFGGHSVGEFALSKDGTQIATVGAGRYLELLDAGSGQLIKRFQLPDFIVPPIYAVAFSPDGRFIAVGNRANIIDLTSYKYIFWYLTSQFTVLEVATGKFSSEDEFNSSDPHLGFVRSLAFSPDGSRLAVGYSNSQAAIFDVKSQTQISILRPDKNFGRGFVMGLAWRPDGQEIATSMGDGAVRLWDASTGKLKTSLRGHTGFVRSIAYNKNGKSLASASKDSTVRIWNLETKTATILRGHTGIVSSVAWGANDTLVSGGADGSLRLWRSGTTVFSLQAAKDVILNLQFTPDGSSVLALSRDNTLRRFGFGDRP
jgi:WD40 repeat protein